MGARALGRGLFLGGRGSPRDSAPLRCADYHRCIKNMNRRGKSTEPCEYYFHVYHSLCPISWVSGQRGAGWNGRRAGAGAEATAPSLSRCSAGTSRSRKELSPAKSDCPCKI